MLAKRREYLRPIRSAFKKTIGELIGATTRVLINWRDRLGVYAADWTQVDYAFWDRARRGRATGLELSGLFLKPLGSKMAAWVLGDRPEWRCENAATQAALNEWWDEKHADVLRTFEEAADLGDCYILINPDLSTTVIPPHIVSPIVDENDYSKTIGWRIVQRVTHPTEVGKVMTITDEYTAKDRVHTVVKNEGSIGVVTRYKNVIGMVPIIHVPNIQGVDEKFGKPEGEGLINILHRYGEVLDAALNGNIRQGRPTPVFERMGDPDVLAAFMAQYGKPRKVAHADGTTETVMELEFDADRVLALGGDGTFKYAQPGMFASDTTNLLNILFYLILQHTEIPEFVWGNAISSSKASADAQMPSFIRWVEKKRGLAERWVTQVAQVVVAYTSVFNMQVSADDQVSPRWKSLTNEDGTLTLEAIKWAHTVAGIMDDETAAAHLPGIDVEDPSAMIAKRKQEDAERQAANDAQIGAQIDAQANQPDQKSSTQMAFPDYELPAAA